MEIKESGHGYHLIELSDNELVLLRNALRNRYNYYSDRFYETLCGSDEIKAKESRFYFDLIIRYLEGLNNEQ